MGKFEETVRQDTPRLVVMFKRENGKEAYQWGIVGSVQVLTVIGCIVRVQAELAFRAPEPCPESALVLCWDADTRAFNWFVSPDIPVDSLVGMLETIKHTIINTQAARAAAAQQLVLGPDGRPMRR